MPRVCASCRHGDYDGDGSYVCVRPDGPVFDTGSGEHWMRVCDRYASKSYDEP